MTETFHQKFQILYPYSLAVRDIIVWFNANSGTTLVRRHALRPLGPLGFHQTEDLIQLPCEVVKRVQLQEGYIQLFWPDGKYAEALLCYDDHFWLTIHKLISSKNLKVRVTPIRTK